MTIKLATEADVPALSVLVNSAYRGESSKKGWTTEADLLGGVRIDETTLRELIQNTEASILNYEANGQLLGCVYLEKKEDKLHLGMLTVSPNHQTGGIGKQLLANAEQKAADMDCKTITMTVISVRYELIAWYERRGYRQTGETKPFPDDSAFGLPKQPLEFVVLEKVLSH